MGLPGCSTSTWAFTLRVGYIKRSHAEPRCDCWAAPMSCCQAPRTGTPKDAPTCPRLIFCFYLERCGRCLGRDGAAAGHEQEQCPPSLLHQGGSQSTHSSLGMHLAHHQAPRCCL